MTGNAIEIWKNAVALSVAWEELAIPYDRKLYQELCDAVKYRFATDELNNIETAIIKEISNLKNSLLIRIANGYFDTYGRDLTHSIDAEISKLPNSLFNQHAKGFEIEWEANKIIVRDRTIIDVRVVPAEPQQTATFGKVSARKAKGRPLNDEIDPLIEVLAKERPDFWSLSQPRQCKLVREKRHGPDVNHHKPPPGWGDSVIKNRLRSLKSKQS